MENQDLYNIAITMIDGIGEGRGRLLLQELENAESVFAEKPTSLMKIPGIGESLAKEIANTDALRKAEKELAFVEKNNIQLYFITDKEYPTRLRACPDAPLLLYYKGNADLEARRIVSIVGTRHSTMYGREMTDKLIAELSEAVPGVLIVSGLAYGIDITAHRCALKNGLPTVGILAHGLDRIYPLTHRSTALEMIEQGGLLTDYPSGTNPDRPNFVQRNRIIAGLADATVVVESAKKGGSLITAEIAFSYSRDVYAYPGKATDTMSEGCNRLIRQNKAGLITCANDLIEAKSWDIAEKKSVPPVQTQLFFSENSDAERIYNLLKERTELHVNDISVELEIPIHTLSQLLFELEMDGFVKALPGNKYRVV